MTGSTANPQISTHRIIVVDDEPAIRAMVARVLGTQYQVTAAANAHEALALAGKIDRVSLLILDVMMPGMDGFELAKQLRLLPSCAKTPIMFLTARDAAGDSASASPGVVARQQPGDGKVIGPGSGATGIAQR